MATTVSSTLSPLASSSSSSSSSASSSSSSSPSSSSSLKDGRPKAVQGKDEKARQGLGFVSGPFKHLVPLRSDLLEPLRDKKGRKLQAKRINTREEPEEEEDIYGDDDDEPQQPHALAADADAKHAAASTSSAPLLLLHQRVGRLCGRGVCAR